MKKHKWNVFCFFVKQNCSPSSLSSCIPNLFSVLIFKQSSYEVMASGADRFLQTAEMLKPSTPSASHDTSGSSGGDDGAEYYPHIGDSAAQRNRGEFMARCK